MKVYYNEIDGFCCDWLSNLMDAGAITPGTIDDRSIEDVTPADLAGMDRVHLFAGIGVWEYAFIHSGLADYSGIWTGSCPCQPFSASGKGGGFDDERHLWPAFFHLIEECRPAAVLGEQVASKDGLTWLDLVSDDMEGSGYAIAAFDLCAAGFGAPHIRQRLYWSAFAVEHGERPRLEGHGRHGYNPSGWAVPSRSASPAGAIVTLEHADRRSIPFPFRQEEGGDGERSDSSDPGTSADRPGPVNGYWRASDWLSCRDGKWRPVEPGTLPLAHGIADRVGRLRAYGNAIVAEQAIEYCGAVREFIEAIDGDL